MNRFWERLSERERRLAMVTGMVICLALLVIVGVRAVGRLRDLDRTIARLDQGIVNYAEQDARGVSVTKAYAGVAAQHSSAWTEAEIHNRLRQEIYRLALENPDGPPDSPSKLVEIPTLRQGTLRDTGHGYREYQLNIKIPSADVYSVALFLIRLQASPQSLRIDGLDISRPPDGQLVSASINVTRTVVAGSPDDTEGAPEEASKGGPHALENITSWDGSDVGTWKGDTCELEPSPTVGELAADGGSCLKVVAGKADAAAYMEQEFDPKSTYELSVDVAATNPVLLLVVDAKGTRYEGTVDVPGDGKCYRYKVAFTTGGDKEKVKLGAPVILFKDGGTAYLDNVVLKKVVD
ncbi:MAG: hypothetical protein NTU83_13820 [Candidatus Hydrogenedentes bacterium]|nr:hypothetical protein [Candidatus Hydrogenedentota bacterium]